MTEVSATGKYLGNHKSDIMSMALSPDGLLLATGDYRGAAIKIWNCRTGNLMATLKPAAQTNPLGFSSVYCLAFSSDSQFLAAGIGETLQLWNLADFVTWSFTFDSEIASLAFDHRGTKIACGTNVALLYDYREGYKERVFEGHRDYVISLAFSADDQLLATGGEQEDGSLRLWHVNSGSCVVLLGVDRDPGNRISQIVFTPDRITLWAVEDMGIIHCFRINDSNKVDEWDFSPVGMLAYLSPSTQYAAVVTYESNQLFLFDTSMKIQVATLTPSKLSPDLDLEAAPVHVVFNQNESQIAVGWGEQVFIWQLVKQGV